MNVRIAEGSDSVCRPGRRLFILLILISALAIMISIPFTSDTYSSAEEVETPVITVSDNNFTYGEGTAVLSLSNASSYSGTLTYAWYRGGTAVSTAASVSLLHATDSGEYHLILKVNGDDGHTSNTINVSIEKKEIGVTWGSTTHEYDATSWAPTATATGLCGSDACNITVAGAQVNAGSDYTATATSVDNDDYKLPATAQTTTFSITQKSVTFGSADDTKMYDGTSLTNGGYTVIDGSLVEGDNIQSISVSGCITFYSENAPNNNTISNAVIMRGDVNVTSNYYINYVAGTLSITQRPITVTTGTDSKTYDGSALTCDTHSIPTGTLASGDTDSITVIGTITNVGSVDNTISRCIMHGSIDATSSYDITESLGTLTVTQKEIGVTWGETTHVYDAVSWAPTATATGLCGSDVCNITVTGGQIYRGTYTATAASIDNTNYKMPTAVQATSFEIAQRPLTITSGSSSQVYNGEALTDDSYEVSDDGLAGSDDVDSVDITGSITYYTEDPSGNNTISNAVIKNGSIDVTDQYHIEYVAGTLTILKQYIKFSTDSDTKVYDGSPLTKAGYTIISGSLADTDTDESVVTGTITNVGTASNTITVSIKCGTLDVSGSYNIKTTLGTLTVTQKEIGVAWGTTYHTYDSAEWAPAANATGLCGSDVCNVTVTGGQIYCGTYTATASSVDNTNYKLPATLPTTVFEITAKSITLTSKSDTKVYDGTPLTNSGYDVTVGPLPSADAIDSIDVTGSITFCSENAPNNNTISNAVIMRGGVNVTSNYTITYVAGTLAITQRPITVTTGTDSKTYDGFALTCDSHSISAGTLASGDTDSITVIGSITNAGSVNNTISKCIMHGDVDVTSSYSITESLGTLTVTQKEIGVTWGETTHVYDATSWAPTATATGLCGSDVCNITVTGKHTYIGNNYTAVADSVDNGNYKLPETAPTVNYSITPRPITVTAGSTSKVYDGTPLTYDYYTVSDGGLCGSDHIASAQVTGSITFCKDNQPGNNTVANIIIRDGDNENRTTNYRITPVAGTLTIEQREITVTTGTDTKVYDGSALIKDVHTIADGTLATGDTDSITVTGLITNVGSVDNTISKCIMRGDVDVTSSYSITESLGTLTITQRTLTPSLDFTNVSSKIFDNTTDFNGHGMAITLANAVYGEDPTVSATYALDSKNYGEKKVNATDIMLDSGWENYCLSVNTLSGDASTNLVNQKSASLIVTKSIFYNGAAYSYNVKFSDFSGLLGSTVSGTLTTNSSDVGEYSQMGSESTKWSISQALDCDSGIGNYSISYSVKFTILQVTVTIIAATVSKVYDGTALTSNTIEPDPEGLVPGHTVIPVVTGTVTDVGSVTNTLVSVTIKDGYNNDVTANYDCVLSDGTLTVTPRPLVISVDVEKEFDATVLTASYSSMSADNLVTGDSLNSGLFTTTGYDVRDYTAEGTDWEVTIAVGTVKGISNYSVTYSVSMEIKQRAVSIAVGSNMVYDKTALVYTIQTSDASNLLSDDVITAGKIATTGVVIGHYTVMGTDWTVTEQIEITHGASNYSIQFTSVDLEITTRLITASPNVAWSKVFDGTDNFTDFTVGNVIGGDDVTVSATYNDVSVLYANTIAFGKTGDDSGNYDVPSNVSATITLRPLTVNVDTTKATKVYDNSVFTYNLVDADLSNLAEGDHVSDGVLVTGDLTVGIYTWSDATCTFVSGHGLAVSKGIENYDVTYSISMEITSASITGVSVIGYDGTYDGSAHCAYTSLSATTVDGSSVSWRFSTDGSDWQSTINVTDAQNRAYYYEVSAPNHATVSSTFNVTICKAVVPDPTDFGSAVFDGTSHSCALISPLYTVSPNGGVDAGLYDVELVLSDPSNYRWTDVSTAEKTFEDAYEITRAPITISNISGSRTYTGSVYSLVIEDSSKITGLVSGDSFISGSLITTSPDVGDYTDSSTLVAALITALGFDNYEPTYSNVQLSINNATIVVNSYTGYEGTYDGSEHTALVSIVCTTVNNQPYTAVSGPVGGAKVVDYKIKDACESGMTLEYVVSAPNHRDFTGTFSVRIAKATVYYPSSSEFGEAFYNGEHQESPISDVGKQYRVTKNDGGTDVGAYDVELTLRDPSNYRWQNPLDPAAKTFEGAFQIVEAIMIVYVSESKMFDGTVLSVGFSDFAVSGLVAGDYLTAGELTTTANTVKDYTVQTTDWVISEQLACHAGINKYKVKFEYNGQSTVSLSITQKSIVVTVTATTQYTGLNLTSEVSDLSSTLVPGDSFTNGIFMTDDVYVGNYSDDYFIVEDIDTVFGRANYYITSYVVDLTITPRDISAVDVTMDITGNELVYNAKNQAQMITTLYIPSLNDLVVDSYTLSDNIQRESGSYTMHITGTTNFSGTIEKPFSIAKASFDLNDDMFRVYVADSDMETRRYSSNNVEPIVTVFFNKTMYLEENVHYTVSYPSSQPAVNAGDYAQVRLTAVANTNFIDSGDWYFEVLPAEATVRAYDLVITYGDESHGNGYTVTGMKGTDHITGQPRYSTTYAQYQDCGTYTVSVVGFTDEPSEQPGYLSYNYNFTYISGNIYVQQYAMGVEITANGGVYGNVTPSTAVFKTPLNGDVITPTYRYVGTANDGTGYDDTTAPSKAGTYTVTVGMSGDKSRNYTLNPPVSAAFIIERADVNTPDAGSKVYNAETQVSDLTDNEVFTVDMNSGGRNVGDYAVILSMRNDYWYNHKWADYGTQTISLTFSITVAPLNMTAYDHTITFGEAPAASPSGVSYSGWQGSDSESLIVGTVTYIFNYEQYDDVGDYTITPGGVTAANYDVVPCAGVLRVNQLQRSVIWSYLSGYTYSGDVFDTPGAKIIGVSSFGDYDIALSVTSDKTPFMDAGEYLFTASVNSPNYTLTDYTASLTVAPLAVDIVWPDITYIYKGEVYDYPAASFLGVKGQSFYADVTKITTANFMNVGSYSFEASTLDTNYSLNTSTISCDYDISPRSVAIIWDVPVQGYTYNGYTQTTSQPKAKFYGCGVDVGYISAPVTEKDSKVFMHAGNYTFQTSDSTFPNYTFTNTQYEAVMSPYQTKAVWSISPTGYTYSGEIQSGPTCQLRGIGYDPQSIAMSVSVVGEDPFLNAGTYTFTAENTNTDYLVSDTTKSVVMNKYNAKCTWTYDGGTVYLGTALIAPTGKITSLSGDEIDLIITEDDGKSFRDAGTYNFTATVGEPYSTNYNATYNTKKITITPATATINWVNYGDRIYSGTEQASPTGTVNGIGDDGVLSIIVSEKDGKTFRNAGSYTFIGSLTKDNYTFTNDTKNITVTPANVSTRWEEIEYVYSGSQFSLPKAYIEVLGDDPEEEMTVEKMFLSQFKNAGDYEFSASTDNSNYNVFGYEKTYTIKKAKTEASWTIPEYVYTGDLQTMPVVTAPSKDKSPLTLSVIVLDGKVFVNADTYRLQAVNTNGNYDVSNTEAEVTIKPYVIDSLPDASMDFDAVTDYVDTIISGVGREKIGVRYTASDVSVGTYLYSKEAAAGCYTAVLFDAERCLASNYVISDAVEAGTMTIKAVSISKATVELPTLIYNAQEQTPEPVVKMSGRTLERGVDYQYSEIDYQNNINAGTATLTITGIGSLTDIKIATFEISKCPIVIENDSKTYDGSTTHKATLVTGLLETIAVLYMVSSPDAGSYVYSKYLKDGCYTATLMDDISLASNYTIYEAGMYAFTIYPAVISTLKTVSKSYDALITNTITIDTGVNGEMLYAKYIAYSKDVAVYKYSTTSKEGCYTAVLEDFANNRAANYRISITDSTMAGLYTIVPAQVTIPSQTIVYNGCDGSKTAVITTFRGEYVILNYTAGSSLAGTYTYSPTESSTTYNVKLVGGAFDISNYTLLEEGAGTFVIEKAKLTAEYKGETAVCGTTPLLSVSVTGFVNGETEDTARAYVRPTVAITDNDAGKYVLTPSGGNAYNYEFTYKSGVLSIEHSLKYVGANANTKSISHYECTGCHTNFTDESMDIEYIYDGDKVSLEKVVLTGTLDDVTAQKMVSASNSIFRMNPDAHLTLEYTTTTGEFTVTMDNYSKIVKGLSCMSTYASGATVNMSQEILLGLEADEGLFNLKVEEIEDYSGKYSSLVGKDGVVYDFSLTVDEISRAELGGKVSISIPYTLKSGQDASNVHVYYLGQNAASRVNCTYSDGMANFDTDHFSSYLVVYEEPVEDGINYVLIIVITVAAASLVLIALEVRRRL